MVEARGDGAGPRVVVVGGGSYQWGPKLVMDAAMNGDLAGGTLVLHDTDPVALGDLFRWGERAVGLAGSGLELEKARDLGEALRGADFVVLSISTGGLDAMAHDIEIPERYGVVQTVGDTVGPGGFFRALRNIPVVVGIAREMEKICPGAFLLNLTNPLTALTRAVTKATSIRTIGLCHELFGTLEVLAEEFRVPEERLDVEVAGVNHFIWITRVAAAGRDVTGEVRRRVTEGKVRESVQERVGGDPDPFVNTWGFRTEMCRLYGHLPAAGDRHLCEFLPGYLEDEGERERLDLRRTTIEDRKKKLAQEKKLVRLQADGEVEIKILKSREEISDVIGAIHSGRRSVNVANVPNEGQVESLPRGAVVETLVSMDGLGARGVCTGRLPSPIKGLVLPHAINQEMTVEAGLKGDRELALRTFLADPLVSHRPGARRMFGEMLEAHEALLPQF